VPALVPALDTAGCGIAVGSGVGSGVGSVVAVGSAVAATVAAAKGTGVDASREETGAAAGEKVQPMRARISAPLESLSARWEVPR